MRAEGSVIRYGDNVDTDVIIPARYLNTGSHSELAKHCMEDLDPDFLKKMNPGDIITAGKNFGCGSSREHAPIAIAAAGISCVIAQSFARIFYRNALNIGLPILECPEIVNACEGDRLAVDFATGVITNLTQNTSYRAVPFPPFMQELIHAGGLIAYIKAQNGGERHE